MKKDKLKSFFRKEDVRFVGWNVLAAVVLAVVLLSGLILWLQRYTEHGVEIEVPEVTGLYLEEAQAILQGQGLNCEVIDSTFSTKVPLGTIVEQTPPAQSKVKNGRAIYLIMNAQSKPKVMLPNLYDMSYRQAVSMLKGVGIVVEEIVYEPSEYKDLVLDVCEARGENGESRGKSIEAGKLLEEGAKVVLVVGQGMGTERTAVPDLLGKSLTEARNYLRSKYLTLGAVVYDEEMTEENAEQFVVYAQTPAAGEVILEGTRVDIRLSTDINKVMTSKVAVEEDDFF